MPDRMILLPLLLPLLVVSGLSAMGRGGAASGVFIEVLVIALFMSLAVTVIFG